MITLMAAQQRAALRGYTEHLEACGRAPGTIRVRTSYIRRAYTDLSPWTSTPAELEHWLAGHSWAPASRRSAVASLRDFHEWAVAAGHRTDDPTVGLGAPPDRSACPRPMPDGELAYAMKHADPSTWWLLRVLATTGLRRAECAQLHSRDLDGRWIVVHGKGGRVRRVPVPADVAAHVRKAHGYVFPGRFGGHITPDAIMRKVERATGHGPHSLRHRFATRTYAASHDVLAVQQLLGHASLATTQRYLGLNDDQLIAAARASWAA